MQHRDGARLSASIIINQSITHDHITRPHENKSSGFHKVPEDIVIWDNQHLNEILDSLTQQII